MDIAAPLPPSLLRSAALRGWRPSFRLSAVVPSLAVVIVMAFIVAEIVAGQLRVTATNAALHNVQAIVRGYVDPRIEPGSLDMVASPDPAINAELARLTASGDIERINIWSRDGRIVYSNTPDVRGRRFSIDESLAAAFSGQSVSQYGSHGDDDLDALHPEPSSAASLARFLEIYVPIRGAVDGNPIGVYEVYQDARPIEGIVSAARLEVFLVAVIAATILLGVLWFAFSGASQLLGRQNRLLRERAASEQLLMTDLRSSEQRFRSLVRNSSDVILIARGDGTLAYESPAV